MSKSNRLPFVAALFVGLLPLVLLAPPVRADINMECTDLLIGCPFGPTESECNSPGIYSNGSCEVITVGTIWRCKTGMGNCDYTMLAACATADEYIGGGCTGLACMGIFVERTDIEAPSCNPVP